MPKEPIKAKCVHNTVKRYYLGNKKRFNTDRWDDALTPNTVWHKIASPLKKIKYYGDYIN